MRLPGCFDHLPDFGQAQAFEKRVDREPRDSRVIPCLLYTSRLGTAEVESALVSHPAVAEAAVIGMPDEVRGNVIWACLLYTSRCV